jgi:hypothetical protein
MQDFDQPPIHVRGPTNHELAVNSVHCFTSSEGAALFVGKRQSSPFDI